MNLFYDKFPFPVRNVDIAAIINKSLKNQLQKHVRLKHWIMSTIGIFHATFLLFLCCLCCTLYLEISTYSHLDSAQCQDYSIVKDSRFVPVTIVSAVCCAAKPQLHYMQYCFLKLEANSN